jgi:hypothetical protein
MKYVLLAILTLLLAGCSAAPEDRVTIVVTNHTDRPIVGAVGAGLVGEQVVLWPHMTRSFWVLRSMMPKTVTFTISEKRD